MKSDLTHTQGNFTCLPNELCVIFCTMVPHDWIVLEVVVEWGVVVLLTNASTCVINVIRNVTSYYWNVKLYHTHPFSSLFYIEEVKTHMVRKARWTESSMVWSIGSSILIFNDSEITNSSHPGVAYICKYLTPKVNNNMHVPIASNCINTSLSNQEIQVTFNIATLNVFICNPSSHKRKKRAWYDTLLGGTGTTLGILNGIDLETVRSKLAAAGKDSVDALHILGDWSPMLLAPQVAQLSLDRSMVTQLGGLTVLTGD